MAADALAVRRRARGHGAQVPRHLARGVSAPLRVTAERAGLGPRAAAPAGAGGADRRAARGRRRRSTPRVVPRRRGRHVLGAVALRSEGPLGPRPLAPRGRGRARGHGLPRRAGRAPARARRPPGPLPGGRPAHARPARARHRVRVDPRLRARRRHPPGQLARHRAHAAPDEQPVPGRAGPRGDAADRRRPADGRAARATARGSTARSTPRWRWRWSPTCSATAPARWRSTARCAAGWRRGAPAATRVVRALLDLEPRAEEPDYELAFRSVEGSKRSLVLIFCDLLEETAARPLVDAVPVLARRHAVTVASVRDPDLDEVLATRAGRRARRRRAGRGARRAGRAHARRATCSGAPARRSSRRRPTGSRPRAWAPTCGPRRGGGRDLGRPRHSTSAQYGPAASDADGRGSRQRQVRRGVTKPSISPASTSHGIVPSTISIAGRAARRSDGAARQRPGVDDRPAQPQPGRAGDGDAAQLEQAVREHEPQQLGRVCRSRS